jgi:hypothetical protein
MTTPIRVLLLGVCRQTSKYTWPSLLNKVPESRNERITARMIVDVKFECKSQKLDKIGVPGKR